MRKTYYEGTANLNTHWRIEVLCYDQCPCFHHDLAILSKNIAIVIEQINVLKQQA